MRSTAKQGPRTRSLIRSRARVSKRLAIEALFSHLGLMEASTPAARAEAVGCGAMNAPEVLAVGPEISDVARRRAIALSQLTVPSMLSQSSRGKNTSSSKKVAAMAAQEWASTNAAAGRDPVQFGESVARVYRACLRANSSVQSPETGELEQAAQSARGAAASSERALEGACVTSGHVPRATCPTSGSQD
jgi:cytochrome c551/c552